MLRRAKKRFSAGYWQSIDNQRKFLDSFAKHKKFKSFNDWYGVTSKDILEFKGHTLITQYKGSLFDALKAVYPEFKWNIYQRKHIPYKHWSSIDNQKLFLKYVATTLKITKVEEWKKVSDSQFIELGGKTLLSKHKTISKCLSTLYPNSPFQEKKIIYTPEKQYFLMEKIRKKLNLKSLSQWKSVNKSDFIKNGGKYVLLQYGGNFSKLISSTYPNINSRKPPPSQVNTFLRRAEVFRRIEDKLMIKSPEDWYSVNQKRLIKCKGGLILLKFYSKSLHLLLSNLKSNYKWEKFSFSYFPPKFWTDRNNQYEYMNILFKKYDLKLLDDWYNPKYSLELLNEKHIGRLLYIYKDFISVLRNIYPNYPWATFQINLTKRNSWKDPIKAKKFLQLVQQNYLISKKDEWYRIPIKKVIISNNGNQIIIPKLWKLLDIVYRDQKWNRKRMIRTLRKSQFWLCKCASKLFPNHFISESYKLKYQKKVCTLQIFIPSLNIVLEHSPNENEEKDEQIMDYLKQKNIKLIQLNDNNWDRSLSSLCETLNKNNILW